MEFIHCNVCGNYPIGGQLRYCLSSCGHIVCENCTKAEICPACGAECRLMEISGLASQEVKSYFMDAAEIMKNTFKQFVNVSQFQKKHIKSLGAHYKKKLTDYDALLTEMKKLKIENEDLNRRIDVLEQREQNLIGCSSSMQSPLELGIEIFGDRDNKQTSYSGFMDHRNSPLYMDTPMSASTQNSHIHQYRDDILRRGVNGIGSVGSGLSYPTPISGHSPSPLGHQISSKFPTFSRPMQGDVSQPRNRLTLRYTPEPRPLVSPIQHLTMGRGNFISPAILANKAYNPMSDGGRGRKNDMLERLKQLRSGNGNLVNKK